MKRDVVLTESAERQQTVLLKCEREANTGGHSGINANVHIEPPVGTVAAA